MSYKQRKVVYWNRGGGRFEDVTERLGAPVTTPAAARGAAFGDFDNDGSVDVLVSNVNDTPALYRLVSRGNHWITLKLVGTRSNRSAIGARVRCLVPGMRLENEVRGGGSYISQNDLRVHFGLGRTTRVEGVLVRWPSGLVSRERHPGRPDPDPEGGHRYAGEVGARRMRAALLLLLAGSPAGLGRRTRPPPGLGRALLGQDPPLDDRGVSGAGRLYPTVARRRASRSTTRGTRQRPWHFSDRRRQATEGSTERREAVAGAGAVALPGGAPGRSRAAARGKRTPGPAATGAEPHPGNRLHPDAAARQGPRLYRRNFDLAPDSAAAHLLTAQMMIRVEQEGLAEAELRRAVPKDPKLPQAHLLLGQIALFRGRLDEAIELTRQEIRLHPGHTLAWSQLGDVHVRRQTWDDAIAALQRSIWINPYYSAPYILLGRAYIKKGQPATAEAMLRRAIEYDPNNKTAHYLLGQLLQQMGREDEARKELETAERLQGPPGR